MNLNCLIVTLLISSSIALALETKLIEYLPIDTENIKLVL